MRAFDPTVCDFEDYNTLKDYRDKAVEESDRAGESWKDLIPLGVIELEEVLWNFVLRYAIQEDRKEGRRPLIKRY